MLVQQTKGIDTMFNNNFSYHVHAYFTKAQTTLETNDVNVAIGEFMEYVADGVHCDIMNGHTGEVLAIANNPNDEDYATEEMALMVLGFMIKEAWGEDVEPEEICDTCGGDVVDGVCQYCGRCVECEEPDPDPIEECASAEDMVLKMLQAMGGLPS